MSFRSEPSLIHLPMTAAIPVPMNKASRVHDDGAGFAAGGEDSSRGIPGIRERPHAPACTLGAIAEPACGTAILNDIPSGGF
jgi:glucose-6-phosphate-specific signal transduction histidine kinase